MYLWSYVCAFFMCVELCGCNYNLYMNSTESLKIFGESKNYAYSDFSFDISDTSVSRIYLPLGLNLVVFQLSILSVDV
jgi:hypothetical protein